MKANPGGQLAPGEVIGRDRLIVRLWRVLNRQSLVLSAERRMGKTSIVKKMVAEPVAGVIPVYRDLEPVRDPLEFAQYVFDDVDRYLSARTRTTQRVRGLLSQLTGAEVPGVIKFPSVVAQHWKIILTHTIEDLVQNQDDTIVFFWDELPLMLYNIKQRSGEGMATEILDALRSLRQMHPGLRMVYTGSIGLHHVVTSLRREGYVNDPTNDMQALDVPPLEAADAANLARQLLQGEGLPTNDEQAVAVAIAQQADNIPFFIHYIVDQMTLSHDPIEPSTAQVIVDARLVDSQDPWHLRYYRERLDQYYDADRCAIALVILDVLAVATQPLPFDELLNLVKARVVTEDAEMVRSVLTLLQQDHYIMQEPGSARFSFRHPLIKRFWRASRGLS